MGLTALVTFLFYEKFTLHLTKSRLVAKQLIGGASRLNLKIQKGTISSISAIICLKNNELANLVQLLTMKKERIMSSFFAITIYTKHTSNLNIIRVRRMITFKIITRYRTSFSWRLFFNFHHL